VAPIADFIVLVVAGLTQAAIFTLTAMGFLLIYRGTGVVNFAQGDLITLGAYIAIWASTTLKLPWAGVLLLTVVAMFGVGVLLERTAVAPLRTRSLQVSVVATLGASYIIQTVIVHWQGSVPKNVPSPLANRVVVVFGAHLQWLGLLVIAVAALIVVCLTLVFSRTNLGRNFRAMASDRSTATLYGVPVVRLSMLAWGTAAALAGLAGVLAGPLVPIDVTFGYDLMFGAFGAAMLGGFGSVAGAAVGAVVIGLATSLLGHYFLKDYSTVIPFVLIIVVIAVRPMGFFGRAESRL
jgi:branched-chain amino acid transport system permease protein